MINSRSPLTSQMLRTPELARSLSEEIREVIQQRNVLTTRTRMRVLCALQEKNENPSPKTHAEETRDRLCAKAVQEIISTEKSYIHHLQLVMKYFIQPLQQRSLLPQKAFSAVFGDIESICIVNQHLLQELEAGQDNIGKVFMDFAPYLKFYSTYAKDFQPVSAMLQEWMLKKSEFAEFVTKQESLPEVGMKLNSLLITPVQRIPRYKLLLEEVKNHMPVDHRDMPALRDALTQINAVAWHINEQIRDQENVQKMLAIQKSLQGGQPKIVTPGRRFIREGKLMKVSRRGGSSHERYFFLFSDMLMYCKIRHADITCLGALSCCCVLPLRHCLVERVMGKGVFKVTCKEESIILYSPSLEEGQEWTETLTYAIKQVQESRETLRKESSHKRPLRRPGILKMKENSLSDMIQQRQIKQSQSGKHKSSPFIKCCSSNSSANAVVMTNRNAEQNTQDLNCLSPCKKQKFKGISDAQHVQENRGENVLMDSLTPMRMAHLDKLSGGQRKHKQHQVVFCSPLVWPRDKKKPFSSSAVGQDEERRTSSVDGFRAGATDSSIPKKQLLWNTSDASHKKERMSKDQMRDEAFDSPVQQLVSSIRNTKGCSASGVNDSYSNAVVNESKSSGLHVVKNCRCEKKSTYYCNLM